MALFLTLQYNHQKNCHLDVTFFVFHPYTKAMMQGKFKKINKITYLYIGDYGRNEQNIYAWSVRILV